MKKSFNAIIVCSYSYKSFSIILVKVIIKSFNGIILCSYSYSLCMKYTFDGDLSGWAAPAFCAEDNPRKALLDIYNKDDKTYFLITN